MSKDRGFDVFLSYNSRDKPTVIRLAKTLTDRGLRVWLDVWELTPGRPWLPELETAIEAIPAAAVVVGKDGLGPWQEPERHAILGEFVRRQVPVIPVLLPGLPRKPKLPLFLRQFGWVDFRNGIQGEGIDRLVWGITGKRVGSEAPATERAAGSLIGMPKLPPHFLARPEYLEPLKRAILYQDADKLGITGEGSVGVQGMGGIGKTVLAAAVARDEEVRRAFADGILWVTVGQEPDLLALQAELAAAAGHPEPVFTSVPRGKRELEQHFDDSRTLLVVDDVWTVEAAAAFDVVGAAGRLLITTRNRDVITGLGAKEHRLDVLEPEQALAFLADWSGQDAGELPEVAARVAKACGYLPLALAMIGAMVQHRPTGWDDALTRLERADLDKI